ncbi:MULTISPECIES: thioredoxin family protein [Chryseobacterium]|uniref:thioredoxin family protein n=1 Tax=Chryseobacterium sp. R2A-55 TaxID=2744445 RepID=UPI001F483D23|nr:thioredoxin family protein [Chryseobacterium sp. R2A-55]
MKEYWQKALTFDQYMNVAKIRATNNPDKTDEKQEFYELGLQRMERTLKTFKVDETQMEKVKSKKFDGKVLIISEPWCGDASATVPAVAKFFESAGNEAKVFLRDTDHSLIDQFLVNGTQSIPIVILLDKDFEVINHWGPRPKYGTELLAKFKANPETYPREEFYNDLQVYYSKNRGKDAIEEILELI